MEEILRATARYWFVLPVLLGTIALQFVLGGANSPPAAVSQVSSATPRLRPTFTPTFPATYTPTPTLTPSVTNTPVIETPRVSLLLSSTPVLAATIPAFFSTPAPLPSAALSLVQSTFLPVTPKPASSLGPDGAQRLSPPATPPATAFISPTLAVTSTITPVASGTPVGQLAINTEQLTNPSLAPSHPPRLQPFDFAQGKPATLPTLELAADLQPTPGSLATRPISVPILMYHYLSSPPSGADIYRLDLSVSPQQFDSHLAHLRETGYETISLRQLAFALAQSAPLPPKPVIITFDDGYRDNYDNAFPLLKKYGFSATFFVFTQVIDEYNVDYLTWEMIQEMHRAGMEFGSHSYRHPDLRGRDLDFLVYEIVGSKEAIEQRLGEPVRFFAYPAGRYDAKTIEVLKSANFWGAVTTQWGAAHTFANRYELQRLRIRGNDSAEVVAAKLKLVE